MMRDLYLGNSDAYVVVYSIVAKSTFLDVPGLLEDIKRIKPDRKTAPAILVGNKCDLPEAERQVPTQDGTNMALRFDCMFREVSAKTNEGVTEAFMDLSRNLVIERGKPTGKSKSEGGSGCCTLLWSRLVLLTLFWSFFSSFPIEALAPECFCFHSLYYYFYFFFWNPSLKGKRRNIMVRRISILLT